ncbi:MAG: F0F1 ATP synthase subunit B [Lentimicrobium sp.]
MELITPELGLIFWMTISFGILIFILGKFAWPVILKALRKRERDIEEALQAAEKAREEMSHLLATNEKLLNEAKLERDALLADARKLANNIIEEARQKANKEYEQILASARVAIKNEENAAFIHLKNQIAVLTIEVTEKLLREKLSDEEKQNGYLQKLIDEIIFS